MSEKNTLKKKMRLFLSARHFYLYCFVLNMFIIDIFLTRLII
jgi:hypothetical protein